MTRHFIVFLLPLAFASGCGGVIESSTHAAAKATFESPLKDGNTFSCSSCHALDEPADDGFRRAGHPLRDATRRTSWKNGRVHRFIDAVNSCATEWMGAPPFAQDDARYLSLKAWLDEMGQGLTAREVQFTIAKVPAVLTGGNAVLGRTLFNRSCALCHGTDGRGALQGPNLNAAVHDAALVARRVRTSGDVSSGTYDGLTGGRMPFWAADRLSDEELRDLIAFLKAPVPDAGFFTVENDAGTDGGVNPASDAGTPGSCPKTHARVGWVADFSTFAHGVKGRATMTDDCTVTLSGFYYDGNGIDVRAFAAVNKAYAQGFAVGPQLYRPGQPYVNASVVLKIPAGKTLSDFNSLSIWCVAAKQNFGDGSFHAP